MTWKKTLYEYVQLRNEAEGGDGWLPAMPFVRDDAFIDAEAARLERAGRQRRERGISSVKHETRLKLLRVEEAGYRVIADIAASKRFVYELKGGEHEEERVDRERVTLLQRGSGEWLIQSVQPYIGDHDSTRPTNPYIGDTADLLPAPADVQMQASAPLISRNVFSQHAEQPVRAYYNREAVRVYAEMWWNSYNPQFLEFEVDCTNYVSQCIFAGGAPMHYTGKRGSGWWYRGKSGGQELWSYSWSVAQSLQNYLESSRSGLRGVEVSQPWQLTIGDVISYAWDGNRFTHTTIVTGIAADGMPLVNAHTINSRSRYWNYRDSHAWTPQTAYRFFHIPDQL